MLPMKTKTTLEQFVSHFQFSQKRQKERKENEEMWKNSKGIGRGIRAVNQAEVQFNGRLLACRTEKYSSKNEAFHCQVKVSKLLTDSLVSPLTTLFHLKNVRCHIIVPFPH